MEWIQANEINEWRSRKKIYFYIEMFCNMTSSCLENRRKKTSNLTVRLGLRVYANGIE